MFEKYQNFNGTRKDLLDIIRNFEKSNPEKYMMYSKKFKKYLPVHLRRLEQFTDKGLLPNGQFIKKNYTYNFDHLSRYILIMKLKNEGYSLIQIGKIIKNYDTEQILEMIESDENTSKSINHKDIESKEILSQKLVKLGRREGRVLRSQWIKFAITQWCNCEVRKKEFAKLTNEDVETITQSFRQSLLATLELNGVDKFIK